MKSKSEKFELLLDEVRNYMRQNLKFSELYIDRYKYGWRRIWIYLSIRNYSNYKPEYEEDLIRFLFDGKEIRKFNENEQLLYRSIKQLTQYINTGEITTKYNSFPTQFKFTGNTGEIIIKFSETKEASFRNARRYLYFRYSLYNFYVFCKSKGLIDFKDINTESIFEYISGIAGRKYGNPSLDIPVLRQLMKYAYDEKIISKDLSDKIPYHRRTNTVLLPSVYSVEEINTLLDSFQRNTKIGKRNYAIALLATYLGMRASDIGNLKFENINWERSTINFIQMKTQKSTELPLLPDVGNAIVEYLQYSRPSSDEPFVFLTHKHPYKRFGYTVISHLIQRAFKKTGIDISNRRFGAHALRHSLADRLLKMRTVYPMIAEILGHANTNSTMVYLKIDLKTLEICTAEVPPVDKQFYEQKGGGFYV